VPDRLVNNLHAKKNALLPAVTSYGYLVSGLLGGAVVVEEIFTFKGIGWWTTQALLGQDVAGIMGTTLVFGLILLFTTLVLDILYAVIDPRIRYE
jgi:peptide/nickel transport system permease protein